MDEQQQADLQAALEEVSAQEAPPEEQPQEVTPPPEPEKPEEASEPPQEEPKDEDPMTVYQKKLEAVMAAQRAKFEEQQQQQKPDPQVEYLKRLEEMMKSQQDKPKQPTLAELLNDPGDDDKPEYVKALEKKVEQYDKKLAEWEQQQQQFEQQRELMQRQQWEQQEQTNIAKFIDEEAENFQYVAALKPMNSDADLYNSMIAMYQQGYSPSYKDMADLVETRVEGVLDHLSVTPKFAQWLNKKFGVSIKPGSASPSDSKTITGSDGAESASAIDPSSMSEEESLALALKEAHEAAKLANR